jgi:tetratricopeptide (TPR) repeat protein
MATSASPGPPSNRRRFWGFRVGAVALGLSLFVVMEAALQLGGWGRPADYDDPFVGFDSLQPLFLRDASGTKYEIPPARRRFFCAESFPAVKEPGEFRIFVLGGSTVAGEPYSSETSFTTWLELALRAADARRGWNVVNCGGISYASYRLTPILKECLQYQPDLFILSTGHNEFLEDRTYGDLKQGSAPFAEILRSLARLHTITLCRAGVDKVRGHSFDAQVTMKSLLPAEVNARLDHEGGLAAYHRDDTWAAAIREHFGHNIRQMVTLAQNAGVPIILVRETSNLADARPFKSEHRSGLSADELRRWEQLIAAARSTLQDDVPRAIYNLRKTLEIDGEYPLTWYELGKCYEAQRDYRAARTAFVKARDLDICPLRITTPLEETLFEVAAKTGAPVVDAHQQLEQRSKTGILGGYWLVDHVHPSFAGHQAIAVALLDEMTRAGFVQPEAASEARRKSVFEKHLAALPPIYFERGRRTLELLRGWTQGRAEGVPRHEP